MKKTLPLLFTCLLVILLFTTCKKSTVTPTPAPTFPTVGSMSFKVDGVLTTMNQTNAQITTVYQFSGPVNLFGILGLVVPTNYPQIEIVIPNAGVGTYSLNVVATGFNPYMTYQSASNTQYLFGNLSGQVVITSLTSSNVSGTFQAIVTNVGTGGTTVTHTITEGTFSCAIIQ